MNCLISLPADVPKAQACRALNAPRHWCYPDRRCRVRVPQPAGTARGLSAEEQQRILDELHSERFQDTAPRLGLRHTAQRGNGAGFNLDDVSLTEPAKRNT